MIGKLFCRNINLEDEIKNIAGHIVTYTSKNFHRVNKNLTWNVLRMDLKNPSDKNCNKKLIVNTNSFCAFGQTTTDKAIFLQDLFLNLD